MNQTAKKVTAEIELEVEMGDTCIIGTGFQGYLPEGTRYKEIIRAFGEPQRAGTEDGKIKVQWRGKINGLVFTIYDYKSDLTPGQNTDWHIGGSKHIVAAMVTEYFMAAKQKDIKVSKDQDLGKEKAKAFAEHLRLTITDGCTGSCLSPRYSQEIADLIKRILLTENE